VREVEDVGEAREVVLGSYRAFEQADMEAFMARFAEDATAEVPGASLAGREQIGGYYGVFSDAFSGVRHDFTNIVEAGNTVVVEGVGHASHTAPLATPQGEVPPTGRDLALPFAELFEVEGGLIRSVRFYFDQVTFMTQLGLMPAPAAP
jgi:ketosteroid isomerase-like protein